MATYITVVTDIGKQLIADAVASGTTVNITQFAVGDGGGAYYTPTATMTALVNETWRGSTDQVIINASSPNMIDISAIVPASVGGFTIREMGVFTDTGEMVAICNTPDTEKVVITTGAAGEVAALMHIVVENTDAVTIEIDPNVVTASKQYVIDSIESHNTSTTAHTDLFKEKADLVSGKIPTSQIPTLDYIPTSEKGAANGVAGLDANQKISMDNIPDALIGSLNYRGTWDASTGLDDTGTAIPSPDDTNKGYYWITTTAGTYNGIDFAVQDWLISNGTQYDKVVNSNAVSSVNGKTGAVVLDAADVGAVPASQIVITDVEPEEGGTSTLDENTLIFVYEV